MRRRTVTAMPVPRFTTTTFDSNRIASEHNP
jgi:hypothetical protein